MRPIVGLKRSYPRSILGMLDRVAESIDVGLLILNGQGKVKTTELMSLPKFDRSGRG